MAFGFGLGLGQFAMKWQLKTNPDGARECRCQVRFAHQNLKLFASKALTKLSDPNYKSRSKKGPVRTNGLQDAKVSTFRSTFLIVTTKSVQMRVHIVLQVISLIMLKRKIS